MSKYLLKVTGSDEIINIVEWNGSGSLVAPSGYEFELFVTESTDFINYFESIDLDNIPVISGNMFGQFTGELTGSVLFNGETFNELIHKTKYGSLTLLSGSNIITVSESRGMLLSNNSIILPTSTNFISENDSVFVNNYESVLNKVINENISNYVISFKQKNDPTIKLEYLVHQTELTSSNDSSYYNISASLFGTASFIHSADDIFNSYDFIFSNWYVDFDLGDTPTVGKFYGDFNGTINGEEIGAIIDKGKYGTFIFDEITTETLTGTSTSPLDLAANPASGKFGFSFIPSNPEYLQDFYEWNDTQVYKMAISLVIYENNKYPTKQSNWVKLLDELLYKANIRKTLTMRRLSDPKTYKKFEIVSVTGPRDILNPIGNVLFGLKEIDSNVTPDISNTILDISTGEPKTMGASPKDFYGQEFTIEIEELGSPSTDDGILLYDYSKETLETNPTNPPTGITNEHPGIGRFRVKKSFATTEATRGELYDAQTPLPVTPIVDMCLSAYTLPIDSITNESYKASNFNIKMIDAIKSKNDKGLLKLQSVPFPNTILYYKIKSINLYNRTFDAFGNPTITALYFGNKDEVTLVGSTKFDNISSTENNAYYEIEVENYDLTDDGFVVTINTYDSNEPTESDNSWGKSSTLPQGIMPINDVPFNIFVSFPKEEIKRKEILVITESMNWEMPDWANKVTMHAIGAGGGGGGGTAGYKDYSGLAIVFGSYAPLGKLPLPKSHGHVVMSGGGGGAGGNYVTSEFTTTEVPNGSVCFIQVGSGGQGGKGYGFSEDGVTENTVKLTGQIWAYSSLTWGSGYEDIINNPDEWGALTHFLKTVLKSGFDYPNYNPVGMPLSTNLMGGGMFRNINKFSIDNDGKRGGSSTVTLISTPNNPQTNTTLIKATGGLGGRCGIGVRSFLDKLTSFEDYAFYNTQKNGLVSNCKNCEHDAYVTQYWSLGGSSTVDDSKGSKIFLGGPGGYGITMGSVRSDMDIDKSISDKHPSRRGYPTIINSDLKRNTAPPQPWDNNNPSILPDLKLPYGDTGVKRTDRESNVKPTFPAPTGGGGGMGRIMWAMETRLISEEGDIDISLKDGDNYTPNIKNKPSTNILYSNGASRDYYYNDGFPGNIIFDDYFIDYAKKLNIATTRGQGGAFLANSVFFDDTDSSGVRYTVKLGKGGDGGYDIENNPHSAFCGFPQTVSPQVGNLNDGYGGGGGGGASTYTDNIHYEPDKNTSDMTIKGQDGANGGQGVVILVIES